MRNFVLTTLLAAMFLGGCATGYQQQGFTGGFSERKLNPDPPIYKIRFNGNGYTSGSRAWDFTLLRAAELTLNDGYRRFVIQDEESRQKSQTTATSTQNYYGTVTTNFNKIVKPGQSMVITAVTNGGFDACFVVGEMTTTYKIEAKRLTAAAQRCI